MDNPFLVFVHVEKAGGITMHHMWHHYLSGYISPSPRYGAQFLPADLSKVQTYYPLRITGLGGHRISPTAEYHTHQFRCSVVREPRARLLSHLNWQIHRMGIMHSFEQFVQAPFFQQFQTFRLTRERTFAAAKEVILQHYQFIGLVEDFDRTIQLLAKLCFQHPLQYEYQNKTSEVTKSYVLSQLTASQHKLLDQAIAVDEDVYNWIKEEIYLPVAVSAEVTDEAINKLVLSRMTRLKRKVSNFYLGRILQPRWQTENIFGQ